MKYVIRSLAAICLYLACIAVARAGDAWPQFRGPDGQGHASEEGLPISWSETENVLWKVPIPGHGWSSPVILDGQVWLTTAVNHGESLRACGLDLKTGKLLHEIEVFHIDQPPAINGKNSYASPTPVLESGRLYVHFGTWGTACLDTASAEILWTNRELIVDHKEGPGSSPVVHGNHLLVHCDGVDVQYVAALDKATGQIAWKTPRSGAKNANPDFRKAYCTPLVIEVDGQYQLISPGADRVSAFDPESGKELWNVDYQGFSNVPRPLFGNDTLYVCTGYMQPQLWAIRAGLDQPAADDRVLWRYTNNVPANPTPLLVDDLLFLVSDGGIATCLDARSGKEHWHKRLGGNFSSSPVSADGKIYWFNEEGDSFVIAAAEHFKSWSSNHLEGRFLASPAVVEKSLVARSDTHLYRLAEQTP